MKLLNNIIASGIVLMIGSSIQREIINRYPQLKEEVESQQRKSFVFAIIITLVVALALYLGGILK